MCLLKILIYIKNSLINLLKKELFFIHSEAANFSITLLHKNENVLKY